MKLQSGGYEMKSVLICNQKGGSGKSTIADNLAWSLERTGTPYSFYDLDGQGGVVHETAEAPDAAVAIIDTPGALQPQLREWITEAGVILIPTKMTRMDMQPLQRMMALVRTAGCPVLYILNGANRFRAAAAFEEWFREAAGEAEILKLPQSEQIVQAAAYGISVVEYAPKSPAAAAMLDIVNAVWSKLGLPRDDGKSSAKM